MQIFQATRLYANYSLLKSLHLVFVVLAGAGFLLRGAWMLQDSPLLARRWVRVLPHAVDTALLASAIGLALMLEQYPLIHGWLTAKVAGLVVYIVLGTIALRRGRTRRVRSAAFGGALAAFAYIVAVATSKSWMPYAN